MHKLPAAALSPTQSTNNSQTFEHAEAIAECAKVLLGAYGSAKASDPSVYVAHIRRVLSDYPLWVAKEAACRVPDQLKWLPAPSEVREVCEEIYGPFIRKQQQEERIGQQLAAREYILPRAQQTYEEFCAEMRTRGMPIRKQDRAEQQFDKKAFMAKFQITDQMWDATPEGDCKFKKLRGDRC